MGDEMRKLSILIAMAVLVGCQAPVAKPPLEAGWRPDAINADYGQYPTNYESIIRDWYLKNLKDPQSAIFVSFSKPRKEHAVVNQFKKSAIFGYSVCGTVNAKNSYGGYTGNKTSWFLIRNGTVVKTQDSKYPIYIGRPVNCADGP